MQTLISLLNFFLQFVEFKFGINAFHVFVPCRCVTPGGLGGFRFNIDKVEFYRTMRAGFFFGFASFNFLFYFG